MSSHLAIRLSFVITSQLKTKQIKFPVTYLVFPGFSEMAVRKSEDVEAERTPLTSINNSPASPSIARQRKF